MNATIGLVTLAFAKRRGFFFRGAADFANHHDAVRFHASVLKQVCSASTCEVPTIGSPPMPIASRLAHPERGQLAHRFIASTCPNAKPRRRGPL